MASYSKVKKSTGANGRQTKVVAVATPGTLVHTMSASLGEFYLYAVNTDTVAREITVELGGTTAPDDLIPVTVPPRAGLFLVVPGTPLDGSVEVRVFAAAANVVNILCWENRIS